MTIHDGWCKNKEVSNSEIANVITTSSLKEKESSIEKEVKYVLRKLSESVEKNDDEKYVKRECILKEEEVLQKENRIQIVSKSLVRKSHENINY